MAASDDGWAFRASPYIWGSGLKGDVASLPPAGPINVDLSFSDVLDDLDLAFMGAFEGRKGRLGFAAEALYIGLSADGQTPGPLFSGAKYEQDLWIGSIAGTYALVQEENFFIDAIAGLSFWDLDNKLAFSEGLAPAVSVSEHQTWQDPILGLKGRVLLNEKWFLAGQGLIGVAGDSDSYWDLYGGIGYNLGETFAVVAGYRHKEVDYRDNGFIWDIEMSGPLLGLSIKF
jgi:hypothetical protein